MITQGCFDVVKSAKDPQWSNLSLVALNSLGMQGGLPLVHYDNGNPVNEQTEKEYRFRFTSYFMDKHHLKISLIRL